MFDDLVNRNRIAEYETDWANTDPEVQEAALDALGADDIDDAVGSLYLSTKNSFDLECLAYNWKDLMGIVSHKEHELGLR